MELFSLPWSFVFLQSSVPVIFHLICFWATPAVLRTGPYVVQRIKPWLAVRSASYPACCVSDSFNKDFLLFSLRGKFIKLTDPLNEPDLNFTDFLKYLYDYCFIYFHYNFVSFLLLTLGCCTFSGSSGIRNLKIFANNWNGSRSL